MQKSKFTKLLCLVLSLVMILSAAPLTTFAASADWVFPTYDYSKSPYSSTGKISFDVVIRNTNKDYSYVVTAISITDGFNLTSADLPFTVSAEGSQTVNVAATVSSKVPGSLTFTYNVVDASAAVIDEGLSDTLYFNANKGVVTDSELSVGGQSGISCTYSKVIYATSVEELCNTTIVMENTGATAVTGLMTTKQSNLKPCFIGDYIAFAKTEVNIPAHGKTTVKMFETTSAYDALTAEQKAALWNSLCTATYSGVDWPYVRYGGYFGFGLDQSTTYVSSITVVLFEDYDLKDMLAQEEAMHRQARDYDCKNGEWDTYMTALYNAATFFYEARIAGTWAGTGSTSSVRKIKDYAEALAAAIENLDKCYVPPVTHTHTFENGVCTDCGFKCTHTFENHVCTVCGMADKITNGELLALVGEQKFVSSTGIVFRAAENEIGNYNLYFDKSALTMVPASYKDVEVTSYGYKLTSSIYDGAGGYIDNYYEFYFDGTGFTKLVCSNLVKAVRNDTYLPYHPVTQVSARAATCTENGYTTSYWICTDAGCGKAFTDNTCATEISAETLATYIIPATGHDFTGDYVQGTGDNAGKHARKCVNTGCTAVGLETTANAYEACSGMEDDFTCDLCGYVDEAAAAAAALAAAKAEAKATVNALAEGASDAVKAIVDKAVEDIEAAESESAITTIVANAESKVAVQKELEAVIAAKKADLTTALASAWTDDAKAILNKALTDIETATTITQANTISSSALGQAQGKDNEFNNLLNIYKNNFVNALTGNTLAEADNYLATVIAELEACTNTTDLTAAYQAALPAMQFYVAMESIDNHYDYLNDFDGITDETKALAADAIEVLRTAKDLDEYNELCAEYDAPIYLAAVKDNTIFAIHEFIATEDDSDEVTAIIEKAIADIKAADSQEAAITIFSDAATAAEAQRQAEAEAAEALAEAKAEAAAAVELLGTGDDSDAVTAIIEKALADIEDAEDIEAVEAIVEKAETDVAAQKALEADMAAFEEYKLAQAENCTKLEQAGESQNVKDVIAATATVISMASYNEDKTLAQNKAEIDELVADLENNLPVMRAYETAVTEITEAAGEAPSDAMQAIMDQAFDELANADTVEAINAIKAQALDDVAEQQAAEAAEALAALKGNTITVINTMKGEAVSDEAKALADEAIAAVEKAESIEELDAAFSGLEEAMDAKDAAFAAAKADAAADVAALAGDTASDEVKAIVEKALADIEKATSKDAVAQLAADAETAVEAQKAVEEAAKALADAKEAAKAAIDSAVPADASDRVKALADAAKGAVDVAKTVEAVNEAKENGLQRVADAIESENQTPCEYCGKTSHDSFIDRMVCLFYRIIRLFKSVFELGEMIVNH